MDRRTVTRLRIEPLENRRLLDAVGFANPVDAGLPAAIGPFDLPAEMLDDPESGWSGYLGGNESDLTRAVAVDEQGNAWVTGSTESAGWVSGGSDTSFGGNSDAFVAKISQSGQLLWSTYLGGSADDEGLGIAVDAVGSAWVTGATNSTGWAFGGFDTQLNGGRDAFLAKIDDSGQLLWVTYLGGSVNDEGRDVAVDAAGNAWVTGWTRSPGWVSDGFDVTFAGGPCDAFVAGVDSNGQSLWSSYLGGDKEDVGFSIDVDVDGDLWLAGRTASTGWVAGGFDTTFGGGQYDAVVAKITTGGTLLWSSYLGGNASDGGTAIALDPAGNAWVTGWTYSDGWVAGGANSSPGGGIDAFVGLIGAVTGSDDDQLLWTTYLGGEEGDQGLCVAADAAGNGWVVGMTASPDWIADGFNTPSNDLELDGLHDAFFVELDAAGQIVQSSYLGGDLLEWGYGVAADVLGNVWITGETNSTDWVLDGLSEIYHGGTFDAYVAKLRAGGSPTTGSIGGTVFHDEDADGNWDNGEPPLEDWTIYIDRDRNGRLDYGERSTTTGADGTYTFSQLLPGIHVVAQLLPDLYLQTFPPGGTHEVTLVAGTAETGYDFGVYSAKVEGRYVFYDKSAFDWDISADTNGNGLFDPGEDGPNDDDAIATDKQALLPGQVGSFANYTSYTRGINGVMVDVANLLEGVVPSANDFVFRVGNDSTPDDWAVVATPATVAFRENAGVGGSDRVTITWPDGAIHNQWLEVTVAAADLGLIADDVFYFGNAVGEVGDPVSPALVTAADLLVARKNPRSSLNPAPVDFVCDFNRDTLVDAIDVLAARNNQTNFLTGLQLIDLSGVYSAEVEGRYVFYNASAFDWDLSADTDGNGLFDPGEDGPNDDDAIATDKQALLPGQVGSFANYTSYTRGINGVMVDVANLLEGVVPSANDFVFRVGNDSTPDDWAVVATPATVAFRENAGVGGSDRVTITWPDGAIHNQWLEVTVAAADLGLIADDVFYFGNAVGEVGDPVSPALVTAADLLVARKNPRSSLNPAPVDFVCDFNRDTLVDAIDVLMARNNQTDFLTGLQLIDLSGAQQQAIAMADAVPGAGSAADSRYAAAVCLYDLQQTHPRRRTDLAEDAVQRAVDLLLVDF